jgi:hypothetical protein
MGLVIGILALLVSVTFNLLQLKWRNEQRAERAKERTDQERKDQGREAEQRSRKEAPPEFYNFGGTPGPILVSGNQHSQGFMDFWGSSLRARNVQFKGFPFTGNLLAGEHSIGSA